MEAGFWNFGGWEIKLLGPIFDFFTLKIFLWLDCDCVLLAGVVPRKFLNLILFLNRFIKKNKELFYLTIYS